MILLTAPRLAEAVPCPYLPGRRFAQEYFFAAKAAPEELGSLLRAGWRRFGRFYFRPGCPGCRSCVPLRVDAAALEPTASQRRVLRKGAGVSVSVAEPRPTDEAWEVYRRHGEGRFGKSPDREDFERSFFDDGVPSLAVEYRVEGSLAGLGFLDRTDDGLSSAYFAFDPDFSRYSLGTLSVFAEAALARRLGLEWYYLGYWVAGCRSMEYKGRFAPHQLYDWESGAWLDAEEWSGRQAEDVLEGDVGQVGREEPGALPAAEPAAPVRGDEKPEGTEDQDHRGEMEEEEAAGHRQGTGQ